MIQADPSLRYALYILVGRLATKTQSKIVVCCKFAGLGLASYWNVKRPRYKAIL